MSVKKIDNGRYEVDIRPTGRNEKRIRRKVVKREALSGAAFQLRQTLKRLPQEPPLIQSSLHRQPKTRNTP